MYVLAQCKQYNNWRLAELADDGDTIIAWTQSRLATRSIEAQVREPLHLRNEREYRLFSEFCEFNNYVIKFISETSFPADLSPEKYPEYYL